MANGYFTEPSQRRSFQRLCFPLQEVGEEEEGNAELQTGNDSDGHQQPTHHHGGHTHTHTQWTQ